MLLPVARAVFEETAHSRRQLHAVRYGLPCDAAFELGATFTVRGGCPCVDEYVDAVCLVLEYLRGLDPASVRSYVAVARAHCRLRVIREVQRRRRGRQSQQRTDRLARGAIGRALSTEAQRALLVHLVQEAGSGAPLHGDPQLRRRLAELRAAEFGGTPESHVDGVGTDLAVVRDTAERHGARKRDGWGTVVSWWEYYVETGLGRRERLDSAPLGVVPAEEVDVPDPATAQNTDRALAAMTLRHATRAHDGGHDPEEGMARWLSERIAAAPRASRARTAARCLRRLGRSGALPHPVVARLLGDPSALRDIVGSALDCAREHARRC